jgi:hypothetical protein
MKTLPIVLVLSVAACGGPQSRRVPEQSVCGTVSAPHVRVEDGYCKQGSAQYRWFSADPAGLDFDDYTPIGQPLDDDYLDSRERVTVYVPAPTTKKTSTTAKKTTTTTKTTTTQRRPVRAPG